jgi:IS5 family transposase
MDAVVPWARLVALVEPVYPKGKGGCPPYALETMLRIHFIQQWFVLSDPSMEEALYDMQSLRQFAGLTLTRGGIPDETTILNFRHLLEKHQLANRFLQEINAMLAERGLLLEQGTVIDATFIEAPTSTKNADGKRDPEMHQAKKGNNWHFGMKAHIGTDAASRLVHRVQTTTANGSDISQAHKLAHREEEVVFGDAGYIGVEKREDTKHIDATWHIAMKRSQRKAVKPKSLSNIVYRLEHLKPSVRSKVEHQFRIIKC